MRGKKTGIIAAVIGCFLVALLLLTPIIMTVAVVATPIVVIHDIIHEIGDFLFGSGDGNEAIYYLQEYFDSDEGRTEIMGRYQPFIQEETRVRIPYSYLVIPNIIADKFEADDALIKKQIKAAVVKKKGKYKLRNATDYVNELRTYPEYKNGFKDLSTDTIVGYINEFKSLYYQKGLPQKYLEQFKPEEHIYPFDKKAVITSNYGYRKLTDIIKNKFHHGIDLAFSGPNACGVPIYAVMDGTVTENETTKSQAGANWGQITNKETKTNYMYLHMRDPFPYPVGTEIKKGDWIGFVGSTGISTGCHLHLEVRKDGKSINPNKLIDFKKPILP